ncbi:MAG: hypothetical protein EBT33_05540 [Betaproteobacteria bacterium]|nr:hypothetical protein [Betaproteobacteria bacterium]
MATSLALVADFLQVRAARGRLATVAVAHPRRRVRPQRLTREHLRARARRMLRQDLLAPDRLVPAARRQARALATRAPRVEG